MARGERQEKKEWLPVSLHLHRGGGSFSVWLSSFPVASALEALLHLYSGPSSFLYEWIPCGVTGLLLERGPVRGCAEKSAVTRCRSWFCRSPRTVYRDRDHMQRARLCLFLARLLAA